MTRGSQLKVQLYVNRYADELNAVILAAFPDLAEMEPTIRWAAPLESEGYAEPRDHDFLRTIEQETYCSRFGRTSGSYAATTVAGGPRRAG